MSSQVKIVNFDRESYIDCKVLTSSGEGSIG